MSTETTKTCPSCGEEKPVDEKHYLPVHLAPDGLSLRCRACVFADWRRQRQHTAARVEEARRLGRRSEAAKRLGR
jgi:hypothetical protein